MIWLAVTVVVAIVVGFVGTALYLWRDELATWLTGTVTAGSECVESTRLPE